MKLNLKKSLPYLGGFLGAVILTTASFFAGQWYKGKNLPIPQGQPGTSCQDCTKPLPAPDTSNWKTYRNEELGFEVRYPQEAEVKMPEPRAGCANLFWFTIPSLNRELFTVCRMESLSSENYSWWKGVPSIDSGRRTKHVISGLEGKRSISFSSSLNEAPDFPLYGMVEYGVDHLGDFWTITFHQTSPELYLNWTDAIASTFKFLK